MSENPDILATNMIGNDRVHRRMAALGNELASVFNECLGDPNILQCSRYEKSHRRRTNIACRRNISGSTSIRCTVGHAPDIRDDAPKAVRSETAKHNHVMCPCGHLWTED